LLIYFFIEILSYWTPERLRNARHHDAIYRDGSHVPADTHPNVDAQGQELEPVFIEGRITADHTEAREVHSSNHSKRYPFAFTSGYAPSYTTYPWYLIGKVFFTQNGLDYVCSGSVVNQYIIATAGHCVYDGINGGGWSYNFVFYPGYNNGAAPYGAWAAYQLWTTTEWTTYGSFCKDYAFAILNENSAGQAIGDYLGWFGCLYNAGQSLSWRSLGYPQEAPFTGAWDYYADSALGVVDSSCGGRCGSSCSPSTQGIGTDTTGGASGGPWIYQWGTNYYVNSINSYKYTNQPNAIYGPYWDSAWYSLFSEVVVIVP